MELGVPVNDGPGFVPFGRVSNPNALPGDRFSVLFVLHDVFLIVSEQQSPSPPIGRYSVAPR